MDPESGLVVSATGSQQQLIQSQHRPSPLQAPLVRLTGHQGEVLAARFDPSGQVIASAGSDRQILLWDSFGENRNFGLIQGHKGAVLDLAWSRDSSTIHSVSADWSVGVWDTESGKRIRNHTGHKDIVNCIDVVKRGVELTVSGSDDSSIGIWDSRVKQSVGYIQTDFPILAIALDEDGSRIFSGGIDNDISVYDSRFPENPIYKMPGHTDSITSLQVKDSSSLLLSNAMDSTVQTWDIRPFAPPDRRVKSFDGAPHGIDQNLIRASFTPNGEQISAGSADKSVAVWDTNTGSLRFKLPGHSGTVNDSRFHPIYPSIILTASSDRSIILGELGSSSS